MGSYKVQMKKSKFKEYYALNLSFISPTLCVICLLAGAAAGILTESAAAFTGFTAGAWVVCLPSVMKVCSVTLYQNEAYFYQSFPVTPLQTVLAKVAVCAQLLQIGPLAFFTAKLVTAGQLYGLEKGGLPAVILGFIGFEAFCLLSAGIILQGMDFGNNFRDRKKGKPAAAATVIAIGVTFGLLLLVLAKITLKHLDNMTVVSVSAAGLVLCSILCILMNSARMKKYYSL